MNRLKTSTSLFCAAAVLGLSAQASAHVGLTSPVRAGGHEKLTFRVGHGCAGSDVVRIEIEIPEAVTSVRAMPSAWGEAELTRNDEDLVTSVAWQKDNARELDDHSYEFQLAITVPDEPFTVLYFKTTQFCEDSEGEASQIAWSATREEVAEDPDLDPSPLTVVLPGRSPGWNKYEAPVEITDLRMFDDAQIVWVGDAAYSANETTAEMIEDDDSVDVLENISEGATIWVKY